MGRGEGVWNTWDVSDEAAPAPAVPLRRGEEFRGKRVMVNSSTMLAGQLLFTLIGFATTPSCSPTSGSTSSACGP